jgi:hypothetical protein
VINLVIDYIVAIILFTTVIFQQQFTVASPTEGTDNQTANSKQEFLNHPLTAT